MAIFKKRRKHYTTPTCNASKGAEVIPKTLQKILEGISSHYSLHPNLHASQNTERSSSLKNVGAQKSRREIEVAILVVAWFVKYYLRCFCLFDTVILWFDLLNIVRCLMDKFISVCFSLLDIVWYLIDKITKLWCAVDKNIPKNIYQTKPN
jgi:hypothetical protein